MRTWIRPLFAMLLGAGVIALTGAPAAASCAGPPQDSTHAFTGTVTALRWEGRLATVVTEAGDTVEVRGTPGGAHSVTSVDREFQLGARYEFHPENGASPYQDNACTATHKIAGAAHGAATGPAAGPSSPAAPLAAGLGVALLLAAVPGVLIARRRLSPATD